MPAEGVVTHETGRELHSWIERAAEHWLRLQSFTTTTRFAPGFTDQCSNREPIATVLPVTNASS